MTSLELAAHEAGGQRQRDQRDDGHRPGIGQHVGSWQRLEEAALQNDQEVFERDALGDPLQYARHVLDRRGEAGHEDGERKVREEMEAAIRAANAQAEKTLRDAKDASADYVQKAEKDVTTIAMSVVEKVLPQHFIDVPQVILPLVREAILKVKDQKELLIHVPPASYGLVLMARDEFRSLLTYGDATIEVLSDDSMQPGDCLVETPNGSVDARLATQIEMLKQAVKDVML